MTVLFLLLFAGLVLLAVRLPVRFVAGHLADNIGKGLAYGSLHDPEKGQAHQRQWHDRQSAYEGKHTGSGRKTCLFVLAHVQKGLPVFGIFERLLKKEELMDYLEKEPVDVLVTFGAGNIDRFTGPITAMLEKRIGKGQE